jgi:ubiquitin C
MRIQVQTLGSGSVDFDIQETDTVAHVKKLLEEKEGISPEQLRLVAKGKVLRDNETLTAGTSIKVILVVRGGSKGRRA